MYLFLSLAIVYSLPLYGNFSQYYYYTEIEFEGVKQPWIIDSSFNGAIYDSRKDLDYNKKYDNQQQTVQGFINTEYVIIANETRTMNVENYNFTVHRGSMYYPEQEINNYLGLQEYFSPQRKWISPLRLCLSSNGGFFSLNKTEETSGAIKLLYYQNQSPLFLITNISADSIQIFPQNIMFLAEVDFNYPYVELQSQINKELRNAFICADLFCPKRKDQNGLICYERDGMELNTFYQHFKDIEFEISFKTVVWYPQDYFVTNDDNIYCFPVKTAIARNVLGQPFLKHKEVIFNSQHMTIFYNKCNNEEQDLKQQRLHIPYNKRTQGFSRIQIEYFLMIITCLIGYAVLRVRKEQPQAPINPFIDYQ